MRLTLTEGHHMSLRGELTMALAALRVIDALADDTDHFHAARFLAGAPRNCRAHSFVI